MYAAGRFKHLFQYSIPTVLIFLIQKEVVVMLQGC